MIHYSCDRCGRPVDPNEELRYVVRVEIEAVMEPIDDEVIEDDDIAKCLRSKREPLQRCFADRR